MRATSVLNCVAVALVMTASVVANCIAQAGVSAFDVCIESPHNISPEKIVAACTEVMKQDATGTRLPNPESQVPPLLGRGAALLRMKQYELAVADFDRVVQLTPSDAVGYWQRCRARAVWNKELAEALDDCNKSLEIESFAIRSSNADALDARAFVELRTGNFDDAIKDCDAALAADSSMASSLYMRGLAKLKLGDAAKGNADLEAAKSLDSDIADTYAGYGLTP